VQELKCGFNQLSGIDVSHNSSLYSLLCEENLLTGLDISQNTNLIYLRCDSNYLTGIDISYNTHLGSLFIDNNQLSELNVSQNPSIHVLSCNENPLTCLNVKNGTNSNWNYFSTKNNPNLTCIEVDDSLWSNTHWPYKDSTAVFSTLCSNSCFTGINENRFSKLSVYPIPAGKFIVIDFGERVPALVVNVIDGLGQLISSNHYDSGNQITLNMKVPAGIYFLQIISEGRIISSRKIIKNSDF
jgi:hypothetical protein